MGRQYKVAVVIGSLRKDGFSSRTARALMSLAPSNLEFEIVPIGWLPLYDQDAEVNAPSEWIEFRDLIRPVDGLLFVTPEYNRSVPGGLKNAIDVGSRPYGKSVWSGKPAGIVSVAPGAMGAFGANHHLRQSLVFLDVPTMQQPEAYIGHASSLFDESGNLINDSTREFLRNYMTKLEAWIASLTA